MVDTPRNDLDYEEALHAMQSGVAMEMLYDLTSTQPKHLRVGINSAMIDTAVIVRLLIEKGVFTDEEFGEVLRLEANREVDKYEDRLRERLDNPNLKLR